MRELNSEAAGGGGGPAVLPVPRGRGNGLELQREGRELSTHDPPQYTEDPKDLFISCEVCGPCTVSIGLGGELIRKAESLVPPQTCRSESAC